MEKNCTDYEDFTVCKTCGTEISPNDQMIDKHKCSECRFKELKGDKNARAKEGALLDAEKES